MSDDGIMPEDGLPNSRNEMQCRLIMLHPTDDIQPDGAVIEDYTTLIRAPPFPSDPFQVPALTATPPSSSVPGDATPLPVQDSSPWSATP